MPPSTSPAKTMKFKAAPDASKAARVKDLAAKRSDVYHIDPRLVEVVEDFNQRLDYGDIDELAEDILANGLETALIIRKDGPRILLSEGHRRNRAIKRLLEQGRWPEDPENKGYPLPIKVETEKPHKKPVDRFFSMLSFNRGKPVTLLEKALTYQRIQKEDPSVTQTDIATRSGETKQAVSDALRLVNSASPDLIALVRDNKLAASTAIILVKQAGDDAEAQNKLFEAAMERAAKVGRDTIMPKDIPSPFEQLKWKYQGSKSGLEIRCNPNVLSLAGKDKTPHIIRLNGLPNGGTLDIGWDYDSSLSKFRFGFNGMKDANDDTPVPQRFDCIAECRMFRTTLREGIEEALTVVASKWKWSRSDVNTLAASAMETVPSHLANPVPEDPPAPAPASSPAPAETPSASPPQAPANDAKHRFTGYVITGVPDKPLDDGTWHETERLVLENPPKGLGIDLLHVLCRQTPNGAAYGYRINDIVQLPNPSEDSTFDEGPEEGYKIALADALIAAGFHEGKIFEDLDIAITEAVTRYWPEDNEGKALSTLPFVAQSKAIVGDPGAIERIKNAPTTNRDGSLTGAGNGGGFVSPDKRLAELEKMLEAIDQKGNGDEERVTTAELVLNFIKSESSASVLKDHLTGKE